jgi:hypothetical protein
MKEQFISVLTNHKAKLFIALGAIIAGGIILQQFLRIGSGRQTANNQPASVKEITVDTKTDGWLEYANTKLGISIKYPASYALRGTPESDMAIFTMDRTEAAGKTAFITVAKKINPLGKASYASLDDFWQDEQAFLVSQGGVVSNEQKIKLNGREFLQSTEDNRQNNYMGIHRYVKQGDSVYEISFSIEGDKIPERGNQVLDQMSAVYVIK